MIVVAASALLEALRNTHSAHTLDAAMARSPRQLPAPHLIDVKIAQVVRRQVAAGLIDAGRGREGAGVKADSADLQKRMVAPGTQWPGWAVLVVHPAAGHRVRLPGEETPRSTRNARGGNDDADRDPGVAAWNAILRTLAGLSTVVKPKNLSRAEDRTTPD